MDALVRLLTTSGELVLLSAAAVVILIALYLFARSVANGEGALTGVKKMWSTLWRNMP
jgi:hypothetical protein